MTAQLTGNIRLRVQTRLFSKEQIVIEVECNERQRYHDRIDMKTIEHDRLFWRKARLDDLGHPLIVGQLPFKLTI